MTKKKSAGAGELRNSAMVLHDFLTGLQAAGVQNQSQFDAINQVLALGSPGKASFHRHMAELHQLPARVARSLQAAEVPEAFLRWVPVVNLAFQNLSGDPHVKIKSVIDTTGLQKAIHHLELCATQMPTQGTIDLGEVGKARASVSLTLETVRAAKLPKDVEDWLLGVLADLCVVLEAAESLGVESARETLHKIIGRAHCNPCPPASNVTDQEFIDEVVAAFRIVGAAVRISAAEGIQLLLGS